MPLHYGIVETKCTLFQLHDFKGLIGAGRSSHQEWKFDPWWIAVLMSSFVTNQNQSEYIHGLVQDCGSAIALAMAILQFCSKSSI